MRKILLLLLFCTFFSACETEDIQSEEQLLPLNKEPGKQILDASKIYYGVYSFAISNYNFRMGICGSTKISAYAWDGGTLS